jgi:preprotein translocase subunit SecD
VTFDDAGPAELQDLTGVISKLEEPRNQMAIVIDGKVASAPVVAEAIAGGQVQMVGSPNDPSLEALVAAFNG